MEINVVTLKISIFEILLKKECETKSKFSIESIYKIPDNSVFDKILSDQGWTKPNKEVPKYIKTKRNESEELFISEFGSFYSNKTKEGEEYDYDRFSFLSLGEYLGIPIEFEKLKI